MDYIDPFTRMILEAEKAASKINSPETQYDFEPLEEASTCRPPIAIFTYSNGTTLSIPFPRKPTAVVRKIDGIFQRPVSVRFRKMDQEFVPQKYETLDQWKILCKSVVRP